MRQTINVQSTCRNIGGHKHTDLVGFEIRQCAGTRTLRLVAVNSSSADAIIDQLPGQPLGLQSGLAVELKQDRGDTRNWKYTESKQTAICYCAKVLMRAMPRVYDAKRQVRLLNEDGSFEMVTLNDSMIEDLIDRLNKSNSIGKCKFYNLYWLNIYYTDGTIRTFRINGSSIKENNDWCFNIKDSDYMVNLWTELYKE